MEKTLDMGASNIAMLVEIGRHPIRIEIHQRMIRYLLRFKNMEKDRLVYKAFLEQQKDKNSLNTWVTRVREILDKIGFSFIFKRVTEKNDKMVLKEIKPLSNKIKKREEEVFEQMFFGHLEEKRAGNKGKLIFYANLKNNFGQEKYLSLKNVQNRNAIRNIRMSTNRLFI